MEQEYLDFFKSDVMILTYEVIILIALLIVCILLSRRQKRIRREEEHIQEEMQWEQLQESLKNVRKE